MLLDYIQIGSNLSISYYGKDGKVHIKDVPITQEQMFNWSYCSESSREKDLNKRSWDNKAVKRDYGKQDNKLPKPIKLSSFRLAEIIDDLPKEDYDEIFEYNLPRTYFVDIETEIDEELSVKESAEQARKPITVIGIATPEREVIVLSSKYDLTPDEKVKTQLDITEHCKSFGANFKFRFKCFGNETDMLKQFLWKMVPKMPMISGWNFVDFDWQYIVNRCKKLNIDISKASPISKTVGKNNFPAHVGIIDYMACYSKWDTSVSQKENLKLDQAGYDVLGVKKVSYSGSLDDLYNGDFRKYVFYNAIDCALVEMLHEKLGVSSIGNTLTYIAKCPTLRMFSPVSLTESILARDYYSVGRVLPVVNKNNKATAYEGAYVKAPVVGYHRFCICNDFASLYPNIIRELNLSPETFIMKLAENDIIGKQRELKKGHIVSESGCVFSKEQGVFSSLVGRVYMQRKSYKKTGVAAAIKSRLLEDLLKETHLSDEEALKRYEEIMAS